MNSVEYDHNDFDEDHEYSNFQEIGESSERDIIQKTQPSEQQKSREELNLAILQKLHNIAQQSLANMNVENALDSYEKCLEHYYQAVGQDSTHPGFQEYFNEILKLLNDCALKFLKEDRVEDAVKILGRCKEFTNGSTFGPFPALRNLTFNHIACCYRRQGKFQKALEYLNAALEFTVTKERMNTMGITHINLCAIHSHLNDHQKALEHAKKAIYECSFEIIKFPENRKASSGENTKKATTLAIAYHNLGVEEDYCGDLESAKKAYFKALEIAEKIMGPNDALTKKFKQTYLEAKDKSAKNYKGNKSPSTYHKIYAAQKFPRPISSNYNKAATTRREFFYNPVLEDKKTGLDEKVYLDKKRILIRQKKSFETLAQTVRTQAPVLRFTNQTNAQSTENLNFVRGGKILVSDEGRRPPTSEKTQRPPTSDKTQKLLLVGGSLGDEQNNASRKEQNSTLRKDRQFIIKGTQKKTLEDELLEIEKVTGTQESQKNEELTSNIKTNRVAFLKNLQQFGDKKSTNTTRQEMLNANKGQRDRKTNTKPEQSSPTKGNSVKTKETPKQREAMIIIQRYVRGFIIRKRYQKQLSKQNFVLLHISVDKLALEKENPFDYYNYHISVWYDLRGQRMIFNVTRLLNKKRTYAAKIDFPLTAKSSTESFIREVKVLAVAEIRSMYLENHTLRFKPLEKETNKNQVNEEQNEVEDDLKFEDIPEDDGQSLSEDVKLPESDHEKTKPKKVEPKEFRTDVSIPENINISEKSPLILEVKEHISTDAEAKIGKKEDYESPKFEAGTGFLEKNLHHEEDDDDDPVSMSTKKDLYQHQNTRANEEVEKLDLDFNPYEKEYIIDSARLKTKGETEQNSEKQRQEQKKVVPSHFEEDYESHKKEEAQKSRQKGESVNILGELEEDEKKKRVENSQADKNQKSEQLEEEMPDLQDPGVQKSTLMIQKAYLKKKQQQPKQEEPKINKNEQSVSKNDAKVVEEKQTVQGAEEQIQNEPIRHEKIPEDVIENKQVQKTEDEEEMPNLEDPGVQKSTLMIQKAFLKKKQKQKQDDSKARNEDKTVSQDDSKVIENKQPVQETEKQIQNESNQHQKIPETSVENNQAQKTENDEEMPNLEDPGVQKSTMMIQNAYLKKKQKQQQLLKQKEPKPEEPTIKSEETDLTNQKPLQKAEDHTENQVNRTEKKPEEHTEINKTEKTENNEEMPDLKDPGVQKSTLMIQNVYLKKKDKQKQKEKETEEKGKATDKSNEIKDDIVQKDEAVKDQPVEQEISKGQKQGQEEEEMPDLKDPGVQKSTLMIQNAYLKKKTKQNQKKPELNQKVPEKPKEDKTAAKEQDAIPKESETNKDQQEEKKEEEEMPNLEDPGVQKSTMMIQKAYLKKKNKGKDTTNKTETQKDAAVEKDSQKIAEDKKEPSSENQAIPESKETQMNNTQKEEKDEEMPNLEDPGVQKSTLMMQKAFLKKKNKEKPKDNTQSKGKHEAPKVEEKTLEEISADNKTITGGDAKGKDEFIEESNEKKLGDEATTSANKEDVKQEAEEEMPNLEDAGVQKSTLMIQKAYLKKKNKQQVAKDKDSKTQTGQELQTQAGQEQKSEVKLEANAEKTEKNVTSTQEEEKAVGNEKVTQENLNTEKVADDDEMPDLADVGVQKSTAMIQKAYLKKKQKQKDAEKKKSKPKADLQQENDNKVAEAQGKLEIKEQDVKGEESRSEEKTDEKEPVDKPAQENNENQENSFHYQSPGVQRI